jgi:hypothetical protein
MQLCRVETAAFTKALRDLDALGRRTPCHHATKSYLWLFKALAERRRTMRL